MEFSHKEEMSPFLFIQLFMYMNNGCSVYSTGYLALSSLYCCKDYPRIGNGGTIKVIPYSFHMCSFFFKLWWKTHNIKATTLTILKHTVVLIICALLFKISRTFLSCKTESPFLLNNSWQTPFYFLFLRTWLLYIPHLSGIMWYYLFVTGCISRSIMSSRFIHVCVMW